MIAFCRRCARKQRCERTDEQIEIRAFGFLHERAARLFPPQGQHVAAIVDVERPKQQRTQTEARDDGVRGDLFVLRIEDEPRLRRPVLRCDRVLRGIAASRHAHNPRVAVTVRIRLADLGVVRAQRVGDVGEHTAKLIEVRLREYTGFAKRFEPLEMQPYAFLVRRGNRRRHYSSESSNRKSSERHIGLSTRMQRVGLLKYHPLWQLNVQALFRLLHYTTQPDGQSGVSPRELRVFHRLRFAGQCDGAHSVAHGRAVKRKRNGLRNLLPKLFCRRQLAAIGSGMLIRRVANQPRKRDESFV